MVVAWSTPALSQPCGHRGFHRTSSPAAASRLTSAVMDRAERMLADNPTIGRRGRVTGTRELVIAGTAYIVVRRAGEDVEILALVHGAREWPDEFPS